MVALQASRRGLLGAIALAPIVATVATCAPQPARAHVDRSAWDRAIASYEAAKADAARYSEEVYDPAMARALAKAPRPPLKFSIAAKNGQVAEHRLYIDRLHDYDDHVSPQFRIAAAEQRQLWEAHRAAYDDEGLDDIDDEWARLIDEESARWDEVILTPAPHLAAVQWKMDALFGEKSRGGGSTSISAWHHRFTDVLMADVARIAVAI
jgi:hypothetical protein